MSYYLALIIMATIKNKQKFPKKHKVLMTMWSN